MARRRYEIVVRGCAAEDDLADFEDLEVVARDETDLRLRGWVVDQSALQGLIARLSWLGLALISVLPVEE